MTNIRFTGNFGHFFIMSLALFVLGIVTLGLAMPYLVYWTNKYFFTELEVGTHPVVFTGSFGGYFLKSLGLFFLSILTLGLAFPYYAYWNVKYFAANLQVRGEIVE